MYNVVSDGHKPHSHLISLSYQQIHIKLWVCWVGDDVMDVGRSAW